MIDVMERLGFSRFSVAGHDRGGRVAYRMALDYPEHVDRLAVLDVLPTGTVWDRADARFALAYWPWSLLAQPEPFPERVLAAAGEVIVDNALGGWGTPAGVFSSEVRAAYIEALRDPAHVHAICEEYRAAAMLDRRHDEADRAAGRRIACPVLALWSAQGALGSWYADAGGPLAIWHSWAEDVEGHPIEGGHFFPEEASQQTYEALARFFRRGGGAQTDNMRSEPMAASDDPNSQRFYHGTKADLKPGDLIVPGYNSNYGTRKQAAYVYLTATLNAAAWGAELAVGEGPGRIYVVEPTGPFEDDPNLTDRKYPGNPTKSYRSRHPLRVTGEVTDWEGHSPEELKAMKDHLERLRLLGVEAIED